MSLEIDSLRKELEIQKNIAYTAGLLQGDITIRTLFESLAEGVVVVNDMGRIICINKRMEEIFGHSKLEVQGEELSIFMPERYRGAHGKHLTSFFSQPRIRPMGIGLELSGLRKDGVEIPIEVSLSSLDIETGKLGLAFITDITERVRTKEELIQKNKQLDDFAQIVAHDLNNNINSLVGFSELLLDTPSSISEQEQRELLNEIASSGRKMSDIINELLLFARIKKDDLKLSELNMQSILDPAIARLGNVIAETGATIEQEDFTHTAKGYGPWIEEVWFNYLSNAMAYGGKPPKIKIGSHLDGDIVTYWIRDNGAGLSEEDLQLVFDEKADARSSIIRGNGLGLTIVKSIITKLDGHVGASSRIGEGSVFYFSLPRG